MAVLRCRAGLLASECLILSRPCCFSGQLADAQSRLGVLPCRCHSYKRRIFELGWYSGPQTGPHGLSVAAGKAFHMFAAL